MLEGQNHLLLHCAHTGECWSYGMASCGGIFRNYRGFSRGCFACPLGIKSAFYAEFMNFICTVEIALHKGWLPLSIESNSAVFVYKIHARSDDVPWRIRSRWRNCLFILDQNQCRITPTFREGNRAADATANQAFLLDEFTRWYGVPMSAEEPYFKNLNYTLEYRINS